LLEKSIQLYLNNWWLYFNYLQPWCNCLYFIVFLFFFTWKFSVFCVFAFPCSHRFDLSNRYEHAKVQLLLIKF